MAEVAKTTPVAEGPAAVAAAPPIAPSSYGPPPAEDADHGRLPTDTRAHVVLPRWTLYGQGAVLVLLGIVFFAAGYYIGRGDATLVLEQEHAEAMRERTLVTGQLVYHPEPGARDGDAGAVVIILPIDVEPASPIPIYGLRPQDPPPPESHDSVQAIEQMGGIYARTDETGQFNVVLPDRGEYRVLLISRHATRPTGEEPEEVDTEALIGIFTLPERLLSHFKYRLERMELFNRMEPIRVDFGESGVAGSGDAEPETNGSAGREAAELVEGLDL